MISQSTTEWLGSQYIIYPFPNQWHIRPLGQLCYSSCGPQNTTNEYLSSARAKDYDSEEYMQKINTQIVEAITTRLDWIGAQWVSPSDSQSGSCSLLDYACGTGKITRVCVYLIRIRYLARSGVAAKY